MHEPWQQIRHKEIVSSFSCYYLSHFIILRARAQKSANCIKANHALATIWIITATKVHIFSLLTIIYEKKDNAGDNSVLYILLSAVRLIDETKHPKGNNIADCTLQKYNFFELRNRVSNFYSFLYVWVRIFGDYGSVWLPESGLYRCGNPILSLFYPYTIPIVSL